MATANSSALCITAGCNVKSPISPASIAHRIKPFSHARIGHYGLAMRCRPRLLKKPSDALSRRKASAQARKVSSRSCIRRDNLMSLGPWTMRDSVSAPTIWTIGHSTHSIEEFLGMLATWRIEAVVDVRRFPASRRYPHFNAANLSSSLDTKGIGYRHAPQLGGRRPSRPDTINLGWKNAGFRGYADYMQTREFWEGLEELMTCGKNQRTAIMCAEAVPWRCHRWLISDALLVHGWTVVHILSAKKTQHHTVTAFAKQAAGRLFYPAESQQPTLY